MARTHPKVSDRRLQVDYGVCSGSCSLSCWPDELNETPTLTPTKVMISLSLDPRKTWHKKKTSFTNACLENFDLTRIPAKESNNQLRRGLQDELYYNSTHRSMLSKNVSSIEKHFNEIYFCSLKEMKRLRHCLWKTELEIRDIYAKQGNFFPMTFSLQTMTNFAAKC